jgi:hypothetical protein
MAKTDFMQIFMQKTGTYRSAKRLLAKQPERMRTPGAKGAPTAAAFKQSAKTAKK